MNWKERARVEVEVRNGDIVRALKVFKRKVISSGHLEVLKDKREYKKPSVKKRKMMQSAVKEQKRFTKKENEYINYIKSGMKNN